MFATNGMFLLAARPCKPSACVDGCSRWPWRAEVAVHHCCTDPPLAKSGQPRSLPLLIWPCMLGMIDRSGGLSGGVVVRTVVSAQSSPLSVGLRFERWQLGNSIA